MRKRHPTETAYCPLCGYKAFVQHSKDDGGVFTYLHCRHGCGNWRRFPDNRIARLTGDMGKVRHTMRKYQCPVCNGYARKISNSGHRGLKQYMTIECETHGRFSNVNGGEFHPSTKGGRQKGSYRSDAEAAIKRMRKPKVDLKVEAPVQVAAPVVEAPKIKLPEPPRQKSARQRIEEREEAKRLKRECEDDWS